MSGPPSRLPSSSTAFNWHSDDIRLRPVRAVCVVMGLAGTVLAAELLLNSISAWNAAAPALIALIGWGAFAQLRKGWQPQIALLLVIGVLLAAVVAVMAFGSMRSSGAALFLAVVVGAGIFLERKALLATVGLTLVTMTGLTWLEINGQMQARQIQMTYDALLVWVAAVTVVAFMVYFSRQKAAMAQERFETELTARLRSEQERNLSMERLRRIFRSSPSPMLAQSARSGRILDANPAFERCYGYPGGQLLGRRDEFLWSVPADRASHEKQLNTQRRAVTSTKGLKSDGSLFDALVVSELSEDPDDRLIISIVTDISEQQALMERLRRSEERFAKAFELSPLTLAITRLSDGTILEVNRSGQGLVAATADEVRGKSTLRDGGWLAPEDRAGFIRQLRTHGRVNGHETRMQAPGGQVQDMRVWAVLIHLDGEDCILSCTINVTEEKRREALLSDLARGTAGGSAEERLQNLCEHMARSLGADLSAVMQRSDDGRLHALAAYADGRPLARTPCDARDTPCEQVLLSDGACEYPRDLDQRFPQASMVTEGGFKAFVGQCLHDDDGQPIGVLLAQWRRAIEPDQESRSLMTIYASRANAELIRMRRDNEIRRLNETLELRVRRRTAELEKLNAELDSFAYSVSHDLRSPLRAIDGFTRLLGEQLQGRLSPDETQLFERVLASTQRMGTLIGDLLALARVSQGVLELAPANLSEMAEQVMQAEQAKQPERVLRWQIEPGMVCRCDARLVRIALENLLGNAVKYTRDTPEARIEMGRCADTASTFFVRDNGVGFDMAHADKLFKPFQRLHRPSEFEGTGIGLATVHRIVERHGGQIDGISEPGRGAEFRFSLGPAPLPLQ
ncbi:MAG: PAS domain S-box protein [Hydrogenophaga sp.]|nr:PAS domain S-box protein [Hydrogenophaga sp.]